MLWYDQNQWKSPCAKEIGGKQCIVVRFRGYRCYALDFYLHLRIKCSSHSVYNIFILHNTPPWCPQIHSHANFVSSQDSLYTWLSLFSQHISYIYSGKFDKRRIYFSLVVNVLLYFSLSASLYICSYEQIASTYHDVELFGWSDIVFL